MKARILSLFLALTLLTGSASPALAAGGYSDVPRDHWAAQSVRRAGELGLADTSFVTPSGLDDEGHFSTAYDMALLARAALQNERFAEICGSFTRQVEFLEPPGRVSFTNQDTSVYKQLRKHQRCKIKDPYRKHL